MGGPPEVGGPLCICTLCTFLRPLLLGRAVLGIDLGFFRVLGLGLDLCVLDSTSG